MRILRPVAAALLAGLLAACSPALNWRDVALPPSSALALLPCKPDRTERDVPLGGVDTPLVMAGCDVGGATFAVMLARPAAGRTPDELLAGWQQATLANMRGTAASRAPFRPTGGLPLAHAERMAATGQRADGRAVQAQAVWTARTGAGGATELIHAVVYADRVAPEVADAFFAGIRLPS